MARFQFLVLFALLGSLLSSNALPVRTNIADVAHISRDVPEMLDLEARAPVRKAPAPPKKVAPKKPVAGKVPAKRGAAPQKKAGPAGKKTVPNTKAGKGGKPAGSADFCELPVKGKQGSKGGRRLVKRGCAGSKMATELENNQVNLGGTVYTIGTQLGQGANGIAYNVDGQPNLIAKKFKPSASPQEFTDEVANLRTGRRLTASGSSTLGPSGSASNWIVTNKVAGKKLTDVQQFKTSMTLKRAECEKYLDGIYTQFVNKYVALQKSTGLFHGDATNENTFFDDNSRLIDFIDFGNMKTSLAAVKAQEGNPSLSGAPTIEAYARARAEVNWPKRKCPAA